MHDTPPTLGLGYYWQDLNAGQRFQTFRRTITETDLVNFISTTGMLETIFIDTTYASGAIKGRPVPARLLWADRRVLMQAWFRAQASHCWRCIKK